MAALLPQNLIMEQTNGNRIAIPPTANMIVYSGAGLIADQDAKNPALSARIGVLCSFDNGQTYHEIHADEWVGGLARDGVSPGVPGGSLGVPTDGPPNFNKAAFVMPQITPHVPISMGLDISFA